MPTRTFMPALLLVMLAAFLTQAAQAGRYQVTPCDTAQERQDLRDAMFDAKACRSRMFSGEDPAACELHPAPKCARDLVDSAVDLAWGPVLEAPISLPKGPIAAQWDCQTQLSRAIGNYSHLWLSARIGGSTAEEADQAARAEVDAIGALCAVPVVADPSGLDFPRIGGQCAAAVPAPGGTVDADALRGCVHTLLSTWTGRIGPGKPALRPNIVFILTDDQRFDTVHGEHAPPGEVMMPTVVNELIAEGVEFTNAYVTSPLCCPSRTSILSGRYANVHQVWETLNGAAYDDSSTLATWLDDAGYYTALHGKYKNGYPSLWGGSEPPYVPPGWDDWFALKGGGYFDYTVIDNGVETNYGSAQEDYVTDVMRDRAIAAIDHAVAVDEPIFLYWSAVAPHAPFTPPLRHATKFVGLAPFRPPSFNEADVSDKPNVVKNKPLLSEGLVDVTRLAQLRTLPAVDEAIAAILARLRQHGILDDTFFVFTSDNGYFWGEHRLLAKNRSYEEAVRVPLVIRYPKLAPLPRQDDGFVLNIDFADTFVELAGATKMRPTDGTSIVDLVDNTAPQWRDEFLTESSPDGKEWVTLHRGKWKYGEFAKRLDDPISDEELYDLENDPFELENIADDPAHAALVQSMADRIRELRPNWPFDALEYRARND